MLLEKLCGKPILVVDYPNEQKAVFLKVVKRDSIKDFFVFQSVVSDCYAAGRVGGRELPRWVHRDNVKQAASMFIHGLDKLVKIELKHIDR